MLNVGTGSETIAALIYHRQCHKVYSKRESCQSTRYSLSMSMISGIKAMELVRNSLVFKTTVTPGGM